MIKACNILLLRAENRLCRYIEIDSYRFQATRNNSVIALVK